MKDNRSRQISYNNLGKPAMQSYQYQTMPKEQFSVVQANQFRNPTVDKINQEIKQLDQLNRQLLGIAQRIKHTNPSSILQTNVSYIDRIENDIHQSLQQLIQNIMEFFTDIDSKLKNVGVIVNNQLLKRNSEEKERTLKFEEAAAIDNNKYEILAERIKGLQTSLRQTQQNQRKLIQVIQNLMQKHNINDQPTLIRQSPTLQNLQNQLKRNRQSSSSNINYKQRSSEKSRLNYNTSMGFFNNQNKTKSIYQNLYTIEESVVAENINFEQPSFRLRQIQQQSGDQVYIKKLYSNQPYSMNQSKRISQRRNQEKNYSSGNLSLNNKHQRTTASNSSNGPHDDKQHRLNFMMGRLKNN